MTGDCAPLRTVEPSVWTPTQITGDGVGVFNAKTFEVNHRVAIGVIILILVGVEQKIGRHKHPEPFGVECKTRYEAQAIHKDSMPIKRSVAVGIFVEADAIKAAIMMGRRLRNFVVDASQKLIAAEHSQARRLWVLDKL